MYGVWEKGKMEGRGKIIYPTYIFHGTFFHNMVGIKEKKGVLNKNVGINSKTKVKKLFIYFSDKFIPNKTILQYIAYTKNIWMV